MTTAKNSNAVTCIDACLRGAVAADRNWSACLHEPEVASLTQCVRLSADCSQLCRATAFLISHGSPFARELCEVCAMACEACAQECDQHVGDHAHFRECAEACREVARECRSYATH